MREVVRRSATRKQRAIRYVAHPLEPLLTLELPPAEQKVFSGEISHEGYLLFSPSAFAEGISFESFVGSVTSTSPVPVEGKESSETEVLLNFPTDSMDLKRKWQPRRSGDDLRGRSSNQAALSTDAVSAETASVESVRSADRVG